MAAPAVTTATSATGQGTSFACAYPAVTAGNFLVAWINGNVGGTITPPSGWKRMPRMGGHTGRANVSTAWAYYKVADGTETGSATFTNSAASNWQMTIIGYSGVDQYMPFTYCRSTTANDDGALGGMASRIPNGLGISLIAYESANSETAAVMATGDFGNWSLITGARCDSTTSTHFGLLGFQDSADFATITSNDGATNLNVSGNTCDWIQCQFVLTSSADIAGVDAYSANLLYYSGTNNAGNAATTIVFSTEFSGKNMGASMLLPGMTLVAALALKNETAGLTGWGTVLSGKAFTQVSGSPYDHVGSTSSRLWIGYMVLDESDCYYSPTSADDITATFDSSIIENTVVQAFYIKDAANYLHVQGGTFATNDTSQTTQDPAAITTARNNSIVVSIIECHSTVAITASTNYTIQGKNTNGGDNHQMSFEILFLPTAGAEDPGTWGTGSTRSQTYTLALSKRGNPALASDFGWGINFGGSAPSEITHPKGRLLMGVG